MEENNKKAFYEPNDPRGLQEPFLPVSVAKQLDLVGNLNLSNLPIKVSGRYITKEYDMGTSRNEKIQSILNPLKANKEKFWGLKGISFDVFEGDVVGVIGVNGSGKSTLLNILSGALAETSGRLTIKGQTSLLSVWDGLRDNLTGLENIRLKSLMMGLSNKEIDEQIDDITEFSELGTFIKQPVKNYSSGMRSKLGFSIAVHQDPDIMIIDEALSVGDQTFTRKALNKMKEFKAAGKTIFFVSHALGQIEEFTDKTMWIQYGELRAYGDTKTILQEYKDWTKWYNQLDDDVKKTYVAARKQAQNDFNRDQLSERIAQDQHLADSEKKKIARDNAVGGRMPWWNWFLVAGGVGIFFYAVYLYTYLGW
ncbi:MAG: ABC transporter ATP-binding protein [Leuconostoc pseudomesenteroides]|uniref:ABC transporter ATP-binding protein n=1 Tax=Leuconostoc pseudomesenteroides TaxID=33968 RepID=UPI001E5540B3|nr:ABC transporter ATP-binding protein [Leuconostoc pseudomesenteroides]MCC7668668.1 teichoic acid ABC transporter ATP-binding protein [Leuconostoc pseudomesenteroides]